MTDIDTSMDPAIAINMVDYPKDKKPILPDGITVVNSIHDPDRDWTQIPEVKKIRELLWKGSLALLKQVLFLKFWGTFCFGPNIDPRGCFWDEK